MIQSPKSCTIYELFTGVKNDFIPTDVNTNLYNFYRSFDLKAQLGAKEVSYPEDCSLSLKDQNLLL